MDKPNVLIDIKLAVTAAVAAFTAWLGILAVPMYILMALNIIDYATGWTAAPYRGQERKSDRGFQGIVKKVCMWLLVGVGAALDLLLSYTATTLGIKMPINFLLGAAVAVWLICNEVISILENIGDIGVKVPPFLKTLIEWLRKSTEDKADVGKGEPKL